jgi:hypothetical protein
MGTQFEHRYKKLKFSYCLDFHFDALSMSLDIALCFCDSCSFPTNCEWCSYIGNASKQQLRLVKNLKKDFMHKKWWMFWRWFIYNIGWNPYVRKFSPSIWLVERVLLLAQEAWINTNMDLGSYWCKHFELAMLFNAQWAMD